MIIDIVKATNVTVTCRKKCEKGNGIPKAAKKSKVCLTDPCVGIEALLEVSNPPAVGGQELFILVDR